MYSVAAEGVEWDWFASDSAGRIAFLSSGGSGQVPPPLLAQEGIIEEFMTLAQVYSDNNAWQAAAAYGLYAYDVDANGGPFSRLAVPETPKAVGDLPERFRTLVSRVVLVGRFDQLATIRCEQFRY